MNQNDAFTSYLIKIGEEVFLLLRSKGAQKKMQKTLFKIHFIKFIQC